MSVYRYSFLSCLAVAFLFLGGCFNMPSKGYQKQWYYMIEVEREGAPLETAPDSILVVRPFSISPMCEAKSFVIRRGEGEYETSYYHQFFVSPSRNLSEIAGRWIADSKLFEQVNPGSSMVVPKYVLEGRVRKVIGDFSDKKAPVAQLEIHFQLVDVGGDDDPVLVFQKTYKQHEPLDQATPDQIPLGVNRAYGRILSQLEKDLEAALK